MANTLTRTVVAAATFAAFQAFGQDALVEGDHYIVNDREIPLTSSETSRALRIEEGRMPEFREAVLRSRTVVLVPLAATEERYHVALLRAAEGVSRKAFLEGAAELARHPAVQASVPVYRLGEMEMLLVEQFVVRFELDVDVEAARTLLEDELQAQILTTDERRRRFAISFPDVPAEDALDRVNALNADPRVRVAEPQFVRVLPPRIGRVDSRVPSLELQAAIRRVPAARALPGTAPMLTTSFCPAQASSSSTAAPNDPAFNRQWALENIASSTAQGKAGADIDALEGWEVTVGSSNVLVAVIDIGVDIDHPDLAGRTVAGVDVVDDDGNPAPPDAADEHGTAVAGVTAASADNGEGIAGVDWRARILPVRFASGNGCALGTCAWDLAPEDTTLAIREAIDLGARVLVNAWGWPAGAPQGDLEIEISDAVAAGAVVVFAAGDHQPAISPVTFTCGVADPSVYYPAVRAPGRRLPIEIGRF